ncbi:hypothetical protein EJ04DRAFT_597545 [Polyplosphaeria fusca]|uniref:DUF7918 domain-containing protein n=1 Tax=Polyplosphaeria fusca TaxID=682080 RepID=A0A9P4RCL0_9PLEO|nr:hypothetical protein EJ04DRAFT_597545 [Polyplosphaeria fusca]
MAILPTCPGLRVEIIVNGISIEEHKNPPPDPSQPKTLTTYVEVPSGTNFGIRYFFARTFPDNRAVSMKVAIDGNEIDEPMHHARDLHDKNGHFIDRMASYDGKRWYQQDFVFAALDIEEGGTDPVNETVKHAVDHVGTIELSFFFLENARRNKPLPTERKALLQIEKLSEKAVKGESMSHQTCLQPPKHIPNIEYFDAEYADEDPFTTFVFKYRSFRALKDLHIVPRSPSPIDVDNMDEAHMTDKQVRVAYRHLVQRQEEQRRLKREREGSFDTTVRGDDDDVVWIATKRRRISIPGEGDEVAEID